MNDTTPPAANGNSAGNGAGNVKSAAGETKNFMLQQLYIKDLSFESPTSPHVFQVGQIEPETELNIRNAHSKLDGDLYEVKLHINVHAKQNGDTIFMAELEQAGLFLITGYSLEETNMLLGTHCPSTLFPYARETISTLVGKGGFPPLILQPISFEALYARAREQQGAQA
jgi:preprotein translocase subunit SecB